MSKPRPAPTHHCQSCGKGLWDNVWPYAMCKDCGKKPCKHGKQPADCNQCMIESDFAFDALREG